MSQVADDGVGMEDHVRARIFDPFFTTKMGARRHYGMNIVHGIVTCILGAGSRMAPPGVGSQGFASCSQRIASGASRV